MKIFQLLIFLIKNKELLDIHLHYLKRGKKISCAIGETYGNSLGIPSNKMQE
ncbi:TPA: hypothetical protein N2G33_001826 [Salmonella enterica]|nr:hypothetical protein [Salmonella enterica]